MFCPNCGNNCGDARFCSSCGTQLQQAAPTAQVGEWKVGMPCPQCGGTKLDGDCCAFCGAQLILNVPNDSDAEEDSFILPQVRDFCNVIILNDNSFVFRQNPLFSKKIREYEVPYAQIESVAYYREGQNESGVIIRWHAEYGNKSV